MSGEIPQIRSPSPGSTSSEDISSSNSPSVNSKTIQIGERTIPTAHRYQKVWGKEHVVQIQIDDKLIPVKVSSLTKRLGWSHQDIKHLAGEKNTLSKEALEFAFQALDSLPLAAQEHTKEISKLAYAQFSKSQKNIAILENMIVVLDPKKLSIEAQLQKGSGEGSMIFSKAHSETVLKTYSLAKLSDMRILSIHEPGAESSNIATEEMRKKDAKMIGRTYALEALIRKDDPLFTGESAPSLEEVSHILNLVEGSEIEPLPKAPLYITTSRRATGDFRNFIQTHQNKETYPADIRSLQRDLTNDYLRIHEKHVCHLDSKLANYLYYETKEGLTARASDFGGSVFIDPTDTAILLPTEVRIDIMFADGCTPSNEINSYMEKAAKINVLIEKQDKTDEDVSQIQKGKNECLKILQKIDMFQLGVAFYQMACKSTESLPYECTQNQNKWVLNDPKGPLKEGTEATLENFYQDKGKTSLILQMLDFNPENRPTAQEVARAFAAR